MLDEAVDLFAVQPLKESADVNLAASDLSRIRQTIESLLEGTIDLTALARRSADTSRPGTPPPPLVYFDQIRGADVLIVEAADRPGLLLAVSLAIFRERLSIIRSHVTTLGETAHDEFELTELDGRAISPKRKKDIIDRVQKALLDERPLR